MIISVEYNYNMYVYNNKICGCLKIVNAAKSNDDHRDIKHIRFEFKNFLIIP